MADWENELDIIYNYSRNPASFSGAEKLQNQLQTSVYRIGLYKINKWLQSRYYYRLFKELRRKFKTNQVLVSKMDKLW